MNGNIACRLRDVVARDPDRRALASPSTFRPRRGTRITWTWQTAADVDRASDAIAHALVAAGIRRGTRIVVMLRADAQLFAIVLGLFKVGAVPVVVDPGLGVRRMLQCYVEAKATAFIGIPLAHAVRVGRPHAFHDVTVAITVGTRWFWGGPTLDELLATVKDAGPFPIAEVAPSDLLLVGFTTGSTGPPKGVETTHGMAHAMCETLARMYALRATDASLVTLPLLGLFDLLLGSAAVLAPMDFARPAHAEPEPLLAAIEEHGVSLLFASPALLARLARALDDKPRTLSTLRRAVTGGAPPSPRVLEAFARALPADAELHATYGSTEALPMTTIEARELLAIARAGALAGQGVCLGRPVEGLDLRLVPVRDASIASLRGLDVEVGEVGEIIVAGESVSAHYFASPNDDARFKIDDGSKRWHRTGDVGSLDAEGRVWFVGRKSQRVRARERDRFPVQAEALLELDARVRRAALVAVPGNAAGVEEPVLVVELEPGVEASDALARELLARAEAHAATRGIRTVLFHSGFPVDVRHNAKIDREALGAYAARHMGRRRRRVWRGLPSLGWRA
jgi:acyl-CoA synthetase (AMP-forming)/AMP-acid ligase II